MYVVSFSIKQLYNCLYNRKTSDKNGHTGSALENNSMVPQPTKEEEGLMPQPKENGSAALPKEEDSLTLQPKHQTYGMY